MDKNKHLESVVKSYQISKEEELLKKHKEKNKEVKETLEKNYGENIYSPFNSGSYAKNTAINTKFDFDLVSPFKRNAFGSNGTLKQMYEDVYSFLYKKYNQNNDKVIDQRVSIGITFLVGEDIIKIDVVPGREFNQDQYEDDKNLNLHVRKKYGNFEEGSDKIKTNIEAQIDHIRDRANSEKEAIRKIVRLLKVWKVSSQKKYKSFFLELIAIKAFDKGNISGSIWDKLKIVLEFIRDNISIENFKLIDPGNKSNDLVDTLEVYEREILKSEMANMLARIDEDDNNIKTYFPENIKFVVEEDIEENKYKANDNNFFSIPPKSERFG